MTTDVGSDTSRRTLSAALRDASLPRAFRGFDERATRSLLDDAAQTCESLHDENLRLRRRVEELEAIVSELEAASSAREEPHEAVGKALLAVARSTDEMLDEARAEAERIREEARTTAEVELRRIEEERLRLAAQLDARVDQARREAAKAAEDARAERATLYAEVHGVLATTGDIRDRLLSICSDERLHISAAVDGTGGRLLADDLHPRRSETTSATDALDVLDP